MPPLLLIVAYDRNRVIGKAGRMPWRYAEDLAHFKATTQGHALILGRKNWQDIGRPLPGRQMVILTRDQTFTARGCQVAHDPHTALALARAQDPEPFVAGGAEIYALFLPMVSRLYLTQIDAEHAGDTYFPTLDETCWRETSRRVSGILTYRILERA